MSQNLDDRFQTPRRVVAPKVELTRDDIIGHLKFGKVKEVTTQHGPRLRKNARATPEFRELYAREESELRALGYTLRQLENSPTGRERWQVTHWAKLPPKVIIERQQAKELSRATDHEIELPVPDGLRLFGYQRAGVAFMMSREASLLADEPGLGKSVEAIVTVNCIPEARKILVICPASLKENWRREIERWQTPDINGDRRAVFVGDSRILPDMVGWVIINYDNLHRHQEMLQSVEYDVLIADEAHKLKGGNETKRGKIVFGIKATRKQREVGVRDCPGIRAKKRILITGTPIVNRPKELFPLLNYLDAAAWPDFFKFGLRYCDGQYGDRGWNFNGSSNLFELQAKLRESLMVRRLKKDVLRDLPPKIRKLTVFEPSGAMRDLTRQQMALVGAGEDYDDAVKMLERPEFTDARATFRRECAIEVAKMPEVQEYIEQAIEESGKLLIFIWHHDVARILKAFLGSRMELIMGDTPVADRQEYVDRFQNDPSLPVLVGGILPMGVGLTLTAASRVLFLELDDVPGNVSQAEDRAHRIGQHDSVLIEHLVVLGTLSAAMAQNCVAKQEVIDKALDDQRKERS